MRSRTTPDAPPPALRRLIAAGLGSVTLLAAGVLTAPAAYAAPEDEVDLTFLNINDFHGRIDANTVKFAGTVEQERAAATGPVAFLSAGDNIGASLFASSVAQDQPTIDVLNALELETSAVGNHEFDQGFPDLTDRVIPEADFTYLGANVYLDGTTTPALPEYELLDMGGVNVGVIGAVTEETPALVSPGGIATLDFGDPVEAVNRVAAQLTDGDDANGEADVIIAEYHEGAGAGTPDGSTLEEEVAAGGAFADIVQNTSATVDAIFTGHTHKQYAWDAPIPGESGTRPILQTGSYGEYIGRIVLTYDTATDDVTAYSATNVARTTVADADLVSAYPRVAEVNAIVTAALAYSAEIGNQPIGAVTADITTAFSGGSYVNGVYVGPGPDPTSGRDDRSKESTIGNLVADALLDTLEAPERGGADIGVVNPGGLRNELLYAPDGVITYAEANAVLPFVNNLWTTTLTGAQVKTMLEQQWQTNEDGSIPSRPYLQLGLSENVSYTFDPDAPLGSHITSVTVNGAPLDPGAQYRIGTFSFLAQGGDNFRVFTEGADTADSGLIDRDAWIYYLEQNQPVSPDFRKHAVAVTGLNATPTAGTTQTLTVGTLDLTSLGAPANTSLTAAYATTADGADAVDVGSATVTGGAAAIDVTIPATASGAGFLILTAEPTGTRVVLPVTVTAAVEPVESWTFGWPGTIIARQGTSIPFTTLVLTADGSAPTGEVVIRDRGSELARATLTEADNGYLRVQLPQLSRGVHLLSVEYGGSDTVESSRSVRLPVIIL